LSEGPDYLICLECETPCYTFEWKFGDVIEAQCLVCGCEDVDSFMLEEDYEAMSTMSH